MPADFPERMRAHAAHSASLLREHFEVIETELIESEDDGRRAAERLHAASPEAVVFAPTMAAPPSYTALALEGIAAPLVIWNAPAIQRLDPDLTQAAATEHTTTVGCVMYANVALRQGRAVPVVTAAHDDPVALAGLVRTIRAVAVAGSLRGQVVLRVGDPLPGYLDVAASAAELAQLGLREEAVGLPEWEDAVESVPAAEARTFVEALRQRWPGDPGPNADRSARVAVALSRSFERSGAIAGTVNCHGPFFRRSPRVGITACLGVACQTERGRPISCTGDQPTAIALYVARALAGAALYCESYMPELESGLVLIAAGGEGDPAWAEPAGRVVLERNDHYPGEQGDGTSVAFALRRGPATILSLSPSAGGWVLAWATGEVVETRYTDMRGPNGMFRFDSGPSGDALSRWIASGATHHQALAPGRLDVEIPPVAAALGIRSVRV
ncbi:MAG: hypothetical protein M3Q61_02350 [Chloroflexota bacterium]|nr:hypothetical protein [Chloroflexota bacterium]